MDIKKIKREFSRCQEDPVYFISNYVKVVHPKRGLVNFDLYPFQRRILNEFIHHRFNILRKFRQAGCTTLVSAYSIWLTIFRPFTSIAILSKGEVEATEIVDRARLMYKELPEWLKPGIEEDNKHTLKLKNGSAIKSRASGDQAGRSLSGNLLIVDEAAFIENMDKIWAAAYPIISTGGSVIALSTVNGVGNWFHKKYTEAVNKENEFNAIDIYWKDHPEYFRHPEYEHLYEQMKKYSPPIDIDKWEKTTRKNLTDKEWKQEYEASFMGTGDTYVDGDILTQLKENVNNDYYIKYNNRMRVWKDPQAAHEYVIGCDASIGRSKDYSAFHIIDLYNGEQVAEFYSNRTPINEFAEIIAAEARLYNVAYVIPERNTIGHNLIYFLFEQLEYENILMDEKRELGILITQKNREQLLAQMEDHIRTGKIKLNSERVVDELFTFIIDPDTGKIEADENCHDDLIMSLAITVYGFKDISYTTPIEHRGKLEDNMQLLPFGKSKYTLNKINGVTPEDIKWLIQN